MLRNQSSNSNEILFRLALEVDPRARRAMQDFKREVVGADKEISARRAQSEADYTRTVENQSRRRTQVRNTEAGAAEQHVRRMETLQRQAAGFADPRQRELWARVGGNILNSAYGRQGADEAFARNARLRLDQMRSASRANAAFAADIEAAVAANNAYQDGLQKTSRIQDESLARAAQGFKTATHGALELARGIAYLGVSSERDLQKVLHTLIAVEGIVGIGRGAIDSARGGSRMLRGLGEFALAAGGGAAATTGGRSALWAGARFLGGAASRVAAPAGAAATWIALDEMGYQYRYARGPRARERNALSWNNRINQYDFERGTGELDDVLNRNRILGELGLRGSSQQAAWGQYAIDVSRQRGAEAMENFERARRGVGLRLGGGGAFSEVRLSPQVALQEQARFAGQGAEWANRELEGTKQVLAHRLRVGEAIRASNAAIAAGMDQVTNKLRGQLELEQQKLGVMKQQAQGAFAVYGNLKPSERRQVNAAAEAFERGNATADQRLLLGRFGALGGRVEEASAKIGRQDAIGTAFERLIQAEQDRAKKEVDNLGQLVKIAEQGAKTTNDAATKTMTEIFDRQAERIVEAMLAAERNAKRLDELEREKRGEADAALRQAEK